MINIECNNSHITRIYTEISCVKLQRFFQFFPVIHNIVPHIRTLIKALVSRILSVIGRQSSLVINAILKDICEFEIWM